MQWNQSISMLLAFYQSYANSAGSFSESADFCLVIQGPIMPLILWTLIQHLGISSVFNKNESSRPDLNPGPSVPESDALPSELLRLCYKDEKTGSLYIAMSFLE